jgi:hypothetical protein
LPDELAGLVESKASELRVDPAHYVAAIVREKLKLPVSVGEFEVFAPADVLEYEIERAPDETNDEFEAASASYAALFKAATR